MSKTEVKPELLSPAGSVESLKAAVKAGADAVYIGGKNFGARAYAENPDEEELLDAIDYVHLFGRKIYLTVNTLEKEEELEKELGDFLEPYVRRGLDGVIVQDFGAVDYIGRVFPTLPIHASTQMAVTGAEGAALLASRGITRVVPARELTLPEIREIREKTGMEIECFIHGAMCYSYSGMCLMSSMIGGRSGNRGRCAGICRLPFSVRTPDGEAFGRKGGKIYPLNMKDLCALPVLPDLIEAGISSFKIEGRMKKPEYTAGVTEVYRRNIDRYFEDPKRYRTEPEDMKFLELLFSRDGFTNGYYHTRGSADMIALHNKRNSDPNIRGTREVQELYDEIRRKQRQTKLRIPVSGVLKIGAGINTELTLSGGGASVTCSGDPAEAAKSRPLSDERILEQIRKFGDSPFEPGNIRLEHLNENPLFIPVSRLNHLRRKTAAALEDALLISYRRDDIRREAAGVMPVPWKKSRKKRPLFAEVLTEEQLRAVLSRPEADGIILPVSLAYALAEDGSLGRIAAPENESGKHALRIALPYVVRSGDHRKLNRMFEKIESRTEIEGILARSLDGAGFLKSTGRISLAIADGALYTMNSRAIRYLEGFGVQRNTMPYELNARELACRDNASSEMVLYGRTPMMISAGCVCRTMESCGGRERFLYLTDRKGASFPVRCCCDFCCNVIYNSVPTSLIGDFSDAERLNAASYRISFTDETAETVREVLSAYAAARKGKKTELSFAVTHGHFRRGVE